MDRCQEYLLRSMAKRGEQRGLKVVCPDIGETWNKLPVGVHLMFRIKNSFPGNHYGILMKHGNDIFTAIDFNKDNGARIDVPSSFINKKGIVYIEDSKPISSVVTTIGRFNSLLSKGVSYDLKRFNCEHFARKLFYGKAESRQINKLEVLGKFLASLLGIKV